MTRITKIELQQINTRLAAENAALRKLLCDARADSQRWQAEACKQQQEAGDIAMQPKPVRNDKQPLAVFFDRKVAYKGYEQKKSQGVACHYEPMNVKRNGRVETVYGLFIH